MEIYSIFEKGVCFGFAAIGFAILFNVPKRTFIPIGLIATLGGMCKIVLVSFGTGIILGSLTGATLIGILSIPVAHYRHAPPLVFSIPAVITMIPGSLVFKMLIGIIKLTGEPSVTNFLPLLHSTLYNGLNALFIILCLAFGVAIPTLITRQESVKHLKLKKFKSQ